MLTGSYGKFITQGIVLILQKEVQGYIMYQADSVIPKLLRLLRIVSSISLTTRSVSKFLMWIKSVAEEAK